jgi:hypothetical protein
MEYKTTAEFNTPPLSHTLSVYTVQYIVGKGGRGGEEVREKEEGQPYTSIVPSSMGVTVHKLGQKYKPLSECISSL